MRLFLVLFIGLLNLVLPYQAKAESRTAKAQDIVQNEGTGVPCVEK